jgi:hypothetical protein
MVSAMSIIEIEKISREQILCQTEVYAKMAGRGASLPKWQ